jgi:hypothetical protein
MSRPWRKVRADAVDRGLINEARVGAAIARLEGLSRVDVEEATPEGAVRIAIRELEKALDRPDHFGVHVHSALIWLRGLDS